MFQRERVQDWQVLTGQEMEGEKTLMSTENQIFWKQQEDTLTGWEAVTLGVGTCVHSWSV